MPKEQPNAKKLSVSKLKKKLWALFSEYIRKRDGLKTTGSTMWGHCITCGKRYHYKMLQAGHFIAGRGLGILFDEQATNAQCYNCNINLKGNTLVYRRKIIELHGQGADEALELKAKRTAKYSVLDYLAMIEQYKLKIKEIDDKNHI